MTDERPRPVDPPRDRLLAPAAMLAAITGWLWPIGVGGRMPVGGDVTQFSMGLMAVLGRALKEGRLPLWNDLWGFGFPGLAESQMGVYYPPHGLLYGLLPVEVAYTASLVLHTYWAALGAYWAGRRFGISARGSALAGFAWGASGMFLAHLPHQWGYTTGSWMPWVLGLAWTIAKDGATLRRAAWLTGAMTMQVLPGHFQFAFHTQVAILGVALWCLVERPSGTRAAARSAPALAGAIAAVLPLAAMQLWPTLQLARTGEGNRTFGYLSAFPSPPVHLINYVAPGLFHGSPLWRSFAWDPFHATPEEHLPYIGLVPLMLALGAIRREWRRDPAVRLLAALAVAATFLGLGPYVPGFRLLIDLPGFSFFRAPARWGLLAGLALALLAGKGFDALRSWPRAGRGVARFAIGSAAAIGLVVGGVLLALDAGARPEVERSFEAAMGLMPWERDPPFARVVASAKSGTTNPLVLAALLRRGVEPRAAATLTLDARRGPILAEELGATAAMILALLAVAPLLARWPRGASALLVVLTAADLLALSRRREVGLAPIRPLTEQSAVLGRLAALPRGARSVDALQNLPQVAGAASLAAYRTLDRPALTGLVELAGAPRDGSVPLDRIDAALRAVGAAIRVDDVFARPGEGAEFLADPALASWLYGRWAERHPAQARFGTRRMPDPITRAWFFPGPEPKVPAGLDPARLLDRFARARPARFEATRPERFEVEVEADAPGTLVVSVLDDPEWRVERVAETGGTEPVGAGPRPIFGTAGGGAWQGVAIPGPGRWRYRWSYRGRAASVGLAVSGVAWVAWGIALAAGRRRRSASD